MKREILFRGKRVDNGRWIEGDLMHEAFDRTSFIIDVAIRQKVNGHYCWPVEVLPETVGQLRYKNQNGNYFDDDVYYHAGYGFCRVSDICELQLAMLSGEIDDIGEIKGNIHDNPELLT